MGYSESDEERFLKMLGRGLLEEFPNPTRRGCSSAEILRAIASHEMGLSEAELARSLDFLQPLLQRLPTREQQGILGLDSILLASARSNCWVGQKGTPA
jgi:hypothetical protein